MSLEVEYIFEPAGKYMIKISNRNSRTMCEICSKLTKRTPERRHSGVFIVNFEHISRLVLVLFKYVWPFSGHQALKG